MMAENQDFIHIHMALKASTVPVVDDLHGKRAFPYVKNH